MRQLIIKDISGSINFLFDNKYLVRTIKVETRAVDGDLKTHIYITGIETWVGLSIFSFGVDEYVEYSMPSYEHMIDMFSFIIAYFSDKNVNELCLSYSGTLSLINSECRDLFKVLGFKIPRRKRDYLIYTYNNAS